MPYCSIQRFYLSLKEREGARINKEEYKRWYFVIFNANYKKHEIDLNIRILTGYNGTIKQIICAHIYHFIYNSQQNYNMI